MATTAKVTKRTGFPHLPNLKEQNAESEAPVGFWLRNRSFLTSQAHAPATGCHPMHTLPKGASCRPPGCHSCPSALWDGPPFDLPQKPSYGEAPWSDDVHP